MWKGSVTGECVNAYEVGTSYTYSPHSALGSDSSWLRGGLLMQCSWSWYLCSDVILHISKTLGKPHSCFCASHCVLYPLEYLENLYNPVFFERRKILGSGFFPSCTNFLSPYLCVFPSLGWVIYGLLNLWNTFLYLYYHVCLLICLFFFLCCDRQALLVSHRYTGMLLKGGVRSGVHGPT